MLNDAVVGKSKIPMLHQCMDAYSLRHKAIANNIANIEVPGYQRVGVKFEDKLREALFDRRKVLATTDKQHIGGRERNVEAVKPHINVEKSQHVTSGINNVDLDREMAALAKNSIDFAVAARLLRHEFSRFRIAMGRAAGGQ
jgi:flagellar basal-body rod protein FlgB